MFCSLNKIASTALLIIWNNFKNDLENNKRLPGEKTIQVIFIKLQLTKANFLDICRNYKCK